MDYLVIISSAFSYLDSSKFKTKLKDEIKPDCNTYNLSISVLLSIYRSLWNKHKRPSASNVASSITWPCLNLNVSWLEYIFITTIPSRIHWGECGQWPGKACDQNVTKAGGVIVAWCFNGSLLGDSRKFVASSSKVLETQRNNLRLKPALSTFYSRNKVRKHLEKKDFENAWKVSRFEFFAFFYDAFLVYLQCLEEII